MSKYAAYSLRPFFSYYGAKFNISCLYPRPEHGRIVEPFAGSACYSLRYPDRQVVLCDEDPVIAGVWSYLIGASPSELAALPLDVESVDDCHGIPQEARWLIGFWLGRARQQPARRVGTWMRQNGKDGTRYHSGFWGKSARDRICQQAPRIAHWRIIETCYRSAGFGDGAATWFIDPPYQGRAGRRYRMGSTRMDYPALADWCRILPGQVIVCEQDGARWLPFSPLVRSGGMRGKGQEVAWLSSGANPLAQLSLQLPGTLTASAAMTTGSAQASGRGTSGSRAVLERRGAG